MHALDPDDGLWPTSSSPLRDCYPALALLGRTEEGEKVADIAFEERDEVDLETLPSRHSGSANFTRPALLTAAFSVLTTMGATSTQPTVVLRGIDSGGGLGLLGRAALGDELLLEALRDIEAGQSTRRQHRVVRAEVVHAPTVKSEWIGVRPSLLAHEIHLFAQGTALGEHRIECADLELRMADGRLVLWSTRLDCEIEPVQSSPVAYAWAHLPVYKFLCEFQRYKHSVSRIPELIKAASWKHSDDPALPFRWRRAPALRWRNVILRPQEWEIQALAPIDRSRARDQVIATLRVVGLPDRICTEVEVEQREFDLTQGEEIEEFVRALSKRKPMRVTKSLWAIPDASPLTFDGQPYANEFIVPLRRVLDDARAEGRRKCTAFHVYVSAHRANEVLGAVERRLAQPGISSHVRGWFYTRMADPFHHLRIRMLHSSGDPHVVEVLASAFSSELAGVGAWKVASAPYEHEHERYGGPELEDAVTNIFALHTACIRRIPAAGELSAAEALLAGAAITCTVLGQFELIELDLRNEAARLREWALELVHDKSAALNLLSILHREHGSAWYAAYETNHEAGSMWYTVRQAFSAAAAASRELAHRMSEVLGCDELSHIAGRLAHMCLNRYFEDDHVVHELASHDLLVRCLRRASHESTPAFEARLLEEIR
jgi:thiopeptide-type bacteriocin biosynthesis protein